uniref:NADH-ubiquinone oxidoreductase chain 6 n=1 Tax=Ducetia japonica TaxID=420856 RepID=A0A342Z5J0_9ORTH|nr:NADH dehydrogenase subunit 6 [Ducetia japonica]AOV63736.1 NADH dehydrogenase subunit 6 [Ducetia japonica]
MQLSLVLSSLLVFPFYFIEHPLAMTLIILLQTLIIALIPSTMLPSFWFSYTLFLVFLGGMLVLFIYITSLAANEIFKPKMKYIILPLIIFITLLLIFNLLIDNTFLYSSSNNLDLQLMSFNNNYHNESTFLLTKLYNTPTKILTLMLVCYLFLTLIVVVKITNIFLGPLRQQH